MQENEDPWSVKKQQLQVSARIQQICSDVAEEHQVRQPEPDLSAGSPCPAETGPGQATISLNEFLAL